MVWIKNKKGFTLIEVLLCIGLFIILSFGIVGIYTLMIREIKAYRENTAIASLADEYMEIARNLPYSQVGTINGNPHGNLPDLPNKVVLTLNGTTYNVYYAVSDVNDPADGGPDVDYKQIKVYIKNVGTGVSKVFLTNIAPKGLENSTGGVLSVQVIDATGQPVPDATIQITNTTVVPHINVTRLSDSGGNWLELGLPASAHSYHVVVTKSGYSSDQTYPSTQQNPNPTKPDATISTGQTTLVSFAIDKLSNLTLNTLNQACAPMSNMGLELRGAKLIGTPSYLKFDNTYSSDANGQIIMNDIEWDTYTPGLTGSSYMIYGSYPIQQISLLPNTSQTFMLILGPSSTNSLLTIVKDSSTGNPIEGANVDLSTSPHTVKITGGSIWSQQFWNGGYGQADFSDSTKYYQDSGTIATGGNPVALRLAKNGTPYYSSGNLTSSSFDSGTNVTSYTTLNWQPTSQTTGTSVKFQIATNNDDVTWNFLGPDGTANTYYTVSGTTINPIHNNNRYIRYKVFLSTTDASKTPTLTSVSINYVSGCFTPGQVIFPGISSSNNYTVVVSMSGYTTKTISRVNVSGYSVLQVSLSH